MTCAVCTTLCLSSPVPVVPFAPLSHVPVSQFTLVPSVFRKLFFDTAFLHGHVLTLHPFTIFNGFYTPSDTMSLSETLRESVEKEVRFFTSGLHRVYASKRVLYSRFKACFCLFRRTYGFAILVWRGKHIDCEE